MVYGVGCRVEGCVAVAACCPVSGWWRAGQCLGGINLVKVAAIAWAGLGWAAIAWAGLGWAGLVVDRVDTQWWCRPSLCRGGSIHLAGGGGGGHVTTTQAGLCHGYADIYTYLHSLHSVDIYTLYIST